MSERGGEGGRDEAGDEADDEADDEDDGSHCAVAHLEPVQRPREEEGGEVFHKQIKIRSKDAVYSAVFQSLVRR